MFLQENMKVRLDLKSTTLLLLGFARDFLLNIFISPNRDCINSTNFYFHLFPDERCNGNLCPVWGRASERWRVDPYIVIVFQWVGLFKVLPFDIQEKQTAIQGSSTCATLQKGWWCSGSSSLRKKRVKLAQVSQNSCNHFPVMYFMLLMFCDTHFLYIAPFLGWRQINLSYFLCCPTRERWWWCTGHNFSIHSGRTWQWTAKCRRRGGPNRLGWLSSGLRGGGLLNYDLVMDMQRHQHLCSCIGQFVSDGNKEKCCENCKPCTLIFQKCIQWLIFTQLWN